ncbi:MAG: hypothetical protein ACRC92_17410 [Peptostreptococcaceae bacterium]
MLDRLFGDNDSYIWTIFLFVLLICEDTQECFGSLVEYLFANPWILIVIFFLYCRFVG